MFAIRSKGSERRRHRLYLTRNTEYHFRDDRCVAVRDRKSGRWLASHLAVNRTLSGGVRFFNNGSAIPTSAVPEPGEALYFGEGGRELVTSVLCSVERPDKATVLEYPAGERSAQGAAAANNGGLTAGRLAG